MVLVSVVIVDKLLATKGRKGVRVKRVVVVGGAISIGQYTVWYDLIGKSVKGV